MEKYLGMLSAKYESNGDSAVIADTVGDAGGKSYGAYQFAINAGTPQAFVSWLNEDNYIPAELIEKAREYGGRLSQYEVGSDEFDAEWEAIGINDPDGFFALQHEFVKQCYYDRAVERVREVGVDIEKHSFALQNVLWSAAVQYGVYYTGELFEDAVALMGYPNCSYVNDIYFDRELIKAIYEVRKSDEWTSGSPSLRPGLINRFEQECEDALALLAEEGY